MELRKVVTADPLNCETPLELVRGWLTPTPLHFVRSHAPTPHIDAASWRLAVEGDAVERPVSLSLDDLRRLPERSQVCWLECAGNSRVFYGSIQGRPADADQLPWGAGAVANAEWTGVPLAAVLDRAGVKPGAVDVLLEGLDEGRFNRPIPIDVARQSTTILAYAMNGADIPPDHGYPVRAIVPGWMGGSSIKWVGRIVVSDQTIRVKTNTESYVLDGPDYPDKPPLTVQPIKSVVALPWEATLPPGPQMVRGFAWSPHGRIAAVEYSLDGNGSWSEARLIEPNVPLAWVRWEFAWDPAPGRHTITTRAVDEQGNRQPDTIPWNRLGYLYNAVVPHPVQVG